MKNKLELSNFDIAIILMLLQNYKEQKDLAKELYDGADDLINKLKTYRYNCLKEVERKVKL